jgi:hypothetical protein
LDLTVQAAVHQGHLKFILEIRQGAQAAQDRAGPAPGGIIHQQPIERIDFHQGQAVQADSEHLLALVKGEEELLFGVFQDGDNDPVENLQPAMDQIQVAVRDGVERSRDRWRCAPFGSPPHGRGRQTPRKSLHTPLLTTTRWA